MDEKKHLPLEEVSKLVIINQDKKLFIQIRKNTKLYSEKKKKY